MPVALVVEVAAVVGEGDGGGDADGCKKAHVIGGKGKRGGWGVGMGGGG